MRTGRFFLLAAVSALFAAALASPALAATVTINSAADAAVAQDGLCTLREAILTTNNNSQLVEAEAGDCAAGEAGPVRDLIEFEFGGTVTTIEPLSLLPEITDPVEIDGSQGLGEKAVRVEIDGNQVTGGTTSRGLLLYLGAEASSIHNIAVNSFPGDGVTVYADEATLEYVIAGMNAGGTEDKGNGRNGITVQGARTTVAQSAASGNAQHGIEVWPLAAVSDGDENTIQASRIGTNREGTAAIPNDLDGIHASLNTIEGDGDDLVIGGAEGLTPGGKCTGNCNLISGNEGDGVEISIVGEGAERTTGLVVQGNHIGIDLEGDAALGNGDAGVRLAGGAVGASIDANTISANAGIGVQILAGGPTSVGLVDTAITGNTIGLGSDGDTVLGNTLGGIKLDRSLIGGPELAGTTVGGTADPTPGGACDGDCNLISGNGQAGIVVFHSLVHEGGAITGTEIVGNYVGTDVSGMLDRGNGSRGIELSGVSGVTVGKPGAANVISGNDSSGVSLVSGGTSGNTIQANLIGLTADGASPLGNAEHGIDGGGGGNSLNTIGGIGAGLGNEIAHNGKNGVGLLGGAEPAFDTPILGNSIYSNGELGIDMRDAPLSGGVTENGKCEEATGANRCQEFPVLTAAAGEGSSAAAAGTLLSDPNKTFRIEVFANSAADPSGNGEGERFLGAVNATTDGSGNATFFFASAAETLDSGDWVSATATELSGGEPRSTSEFSDVLEGPSCDVEGGAGADNLAGGAGAEVICGFGSGDTINAGGGRDAVLAGEGDDTIDVADGEADALVDCGPGNDTVNADSEATDPAAIFVNCETVNRPTVPTPPGAEETGGSTPPKVYKCKGKRATIVGTSKKETIKGTKKADVIVGLGGNDTIKGLGGNDTICGGNGKDTIKGGPGKDLLRGEDGNDRLFGEKGNDRLDGGKGKDVLKGGPDNDRLRGNAGKGDLCDGQSGKKDKLDGKKAGCEKRKRIP